MADASLHWFAMRDLKRRNAKEPAYRMLAARQIEVFTPMTRMPVVCQGRRSWKEVPFLSDLLFVHGSRDQLDPIVGKVPTLQYRFICNGFCEPMVVPDTDMERFIRAVQADNTPRYYLPGEITPAMYGRRVRIIGGPLDGCEGPLLTTRGSKVRRLLVELPNLLTAAVNIGQTDLIELLREK